MADRDVTGGLWRMATSARAATIARLPKRTRTALGKEGAKVARRRRRR